jgi:hypothetical protein
MLVSELSLYHKMNIRGIALIRVEYTDSANREHFQG